MRRCAICLRPCFSTYCSPGCAITSTTLDRFDSLPEPEREAVLESIVLLIGSELDDDSRYSHLPI